MKVNLTQSIGALDEGLYSVTYKHGDMIHFRVEDEKEMVVSFVEGFTGESLTDESYLEKDFALLVINQHIKEGKPVTFTPRRIKIIIREQACTGAFDGNGFVSDAEF